jgi:inner membrane protein
MKWQNHVAIAAAVTVVVDPILVPGAILGATAPDWLEWLITPVRRVRHRTVTHYLVVWAFAVGFFLVFWDFHRIGLAFSLGGLFHVLTDAMTISGIPMGWWSDRKFYLFGGRLKTGSPEEYMISAVVVLTCVMLAWHRPGSGYAPFFFDWPGFYQQGLIDANEWKTNRFKFL